MYFLLKEIRKKKTTYKKRSVVLGILVAAAGLAAFFLDNEILFLDEMLLLVLGLGFLSSIICYLHFCKEYRDYGGDKKHTKTRADAGMEQLMNRMRRVFGKKVMLKATYGPMEMGSYSIIYEYPLKELTIRCESEQGTLTTLVIDSRGREFRPENMGADRNRCYYDNNKKDIAALVKLTHKAISNGLV